MPSKSRRRFATDQNGSTAMIFAVSLLPLLAAVGLAVDFASSLRIKVALQKGLDAAVLAASRIDVAANERERVFNSVLKDNYTASSAAPIGASKYTYTTGSGGSGNASATMKTSFMGLFGFTQVPIAVKSAANSDPVNIEIVFALDISGSMLATDMGGGGSRLDALKTAASSLIDTLMANKAANQSIKFAVVPFTMAVNIGDTNAAIVDGTNNSLFAGSVWAGCVLERRGGQFATDVYNPGATDGTGRWQAYIWPPSPNGSNICNNPSNGTNTGYKSVEPAPLGRATWVDGPNFNCPRFPLTRLTTDTTAIRTKISDLASYPNIGTTIGPAVGWGLRLLSPTGPFGDGASFSSNVRKILVVVTDGELVTDGGSGCSGVGNTASAYRFNPASLQLDGRVLTSGPTNDSFTPYGYLVDSDPFNRGLSTAADGDAELDRLAVAACGAAKARDTSNPIEIFTIAASAGAGPGTRAQTVLAACASDANHFIYAANSTGLDAAFSKIANQTLRLRLTQ